jgi:hypothetical protein
MGNIAATSGDVARFFFLLAKGKLTSASSLAQMRTYHNLTEGFGAGTGKGILRAALELWTHFNTAMTTTMHDHHQHLPPSIPPP